MSEILTDSKLKHCLLEARNINVSYMQRTMAATTVYTSHEQLRAEHSALVEADVVLLEVIDDILEIDALCDEWYTATQRLKKYANKMRALLPKDGE